MKSLFKNINEDKKWSHYCNMVCTIVNLLPQIIYNLLQRQHLLIVEARWNVVYFIVHILLSKNRSYIDSKYFISFAALHRYLFVRKTYQKCSCEIIFLPLIILSLMSNKSVMEYCIEYKSYRNVIIFISRRDFKYINQHLI